MGHHQKLFEAILSRASDANISFDRLCALLRLLGFSENVRGSHHIFRHPDVVELINLQRDGAKAKVYQVRQVRRVLVHYSFRVRPED